MRLAKRAPEDGEILGEDEHRAAVDRAPAGHHPVAWNLGLLHAEIVAAVLDEHVEFLERVVIEQEFDALARGELALGVLRRDALLAAAEAGAVAAGVEAGEDVLHLQSPGCFRRSVARPAARPNARFTNPLLRQLYVQLFRERLLGRVRSYAAKWIKRFPLEMGGKSPLTVLDDADVDYTVCAVRNSMDHDPKRAAGISALTAA